MQDPNHPDEEPQAGIASIFKFLAGAIVIVLALLAILLITDVIDGGRFVRLAGTTIAVGAVLAAASALVSMLGRRER